jgi:hypothetical protein
MDVGAQVGLVRPLPVDVLKYLAPDVDSDLLMSDAHERESIASAMSAEQPPTSKEAPGAPKIYSPYSIHIFALLAPASLLGVLARLGLSALATYDGQSIFSLAYAQGLGCFIMGYALTLKEPFGLLCVGNSSLFFVNLVY